jgi:diacylglycerol kinase family enzyme
MRITIIHNSGSGGRTLTGPDLIAAAADAGHRASYASTDDEAAVVKLLSDPGELVAIVGGDGTMRNVASRLMGRKVPVTLIPAGTANNIGKSLGITGEARDLIAGWSTGRQIPFDTGVVRGANGTCAMFEGMGFGPIAVTIAALSPLTDAEARADFTDDEVRRDLKVLREVLADYPVHECSVKLDGRDLSGEYILVEVMNIRSVGPNIVLAPDADVSDGMFDLVLLTDGDRATLRDYLTSRLEGKPVPVQFPSHRGRHVELGWRGSRVHIDDLVWPHEREASSGQSWSRDGRIEIEVLMNPGSLDVLVPRPAPPATDVSPDDEADVARTAK